MPWFLVGDQMHSAPMIRKLLATEPAAVGLWTVAGSWSSDHLTDGFIPDDDLPWLFPDAPRLASALVAAGAWKRVKNGHRFVTDGVTHKMPTAQAVEKERKDAAERQRRSREAKLSRRDSRVTNDVSHTAHPGPSPGVVVVDVVSRTNGSSNDATAVTDAIIKEIHDQTGTVIDPAWAQRIAAGLVTPGVANPAAYVRQCIRNEPNPGLRFLPQYGRHAKESQ